MRCTVTGCATGGRHEVYCNWLCNWGRHDVYCNRLCNLGGGMSFTVTGCATGGGMSCTVSGFAKGGGWVVPVPGCTPGGGMRLCPLCLYGTLGLTQNRYLSYNWDFLWPLFLLLSITLLVPTLPKYLFHCCTGRDHCKAMKALLNQTIVNGYFLANLSKKNCAFNLQYFSQTFMQFRTVKRINCDNRIIIKSRSNRGHIDSQFNALSPQGWNCWWAKEKWETNRLSTPNGAWPLHTITRFRIAFRRSIIGCHYVRQAFSLLISKQGHMTINFLLLFESPFKITSISPSKQQYLTHHKSVILSTGFEVLIAMLLEVQVYCDVTLRYWASTYRRYERSYCLYLQETACPRRQ